MAIYPAYESYRAADISWLSSVPSHWRTTRLKREAQIQTGVTLGKVYAVEVESRPYLRVANVQAGFLDLKHVKNIEVPRSEALKSELRPNDVVLTEGGDIDKLGRGAIWSGQIKGCIHQNHVFAVRPDPTTLSPKFLTYILESPHGRSYFQVTAKQTTNLAATNRSTLGRFPLLLPPRPEQDQIVAYLRAQDAHIARFIKAKRELIKLLTEQKLRIIDHAVTRGLDASVALKPSGIEWLGDVPEHWEVERLKWVCRFTYGDSLSDANRRQGDVPVYGSNGQVGMHDKANTLGPCIVVGRKGSFGKVNYSESDLFAIDTAYSVDRKCTKANIRWLYYLLVWCRLDRVSKDSAVPGLDRTDALNTLVPVPDWVEQEWIAKKLDIETAEVNHAITKVEEEIKLIREYRDRLIADVVTGQVDVRGWQPGPDDVVDDAALAALGDDPDDVTEAEDGDGEEN